MSDDRTRVREARLHDANKLFVDAIAWSDGMVSIEGQDLGPNTPGGDEYEYFIYVAPDAVPALVAALGGQPGDDPVALLGARGESFVMYGERRWLEENGIPFEFQTW